MSDKKEYDAWNPGVLSSIPKEYMHLSSCFRPENVFTSIDDAFEFAKLTGLKAERVVACRPERLIVHETFVRVMADINIQEGHEYQDLGIRYRETVKTLLDQYITPHMDAFTGRYEDIRADVSNEISEILNATIFEKIEPKVDKKKSGLSALFGFFQKDDKKVAKPVLSTEEAHYQYVQGFKEKATNAETAQSRTIHKYLHKVASLLMIQHGRVLIDRDVLEKVVNNLTCNDYGSKILGDMVAPYIKNAMEVEGYKSIPISTEAIVISLKGASAAGKSTLRLKLKTAPTHYLEETGFNGTDDFALISPDICRKSLIDYDDLGVAERYAGSLTGEELVLIDMKLDRYMKDKVETAPQNAMSNILIDRFRFDSFDAQSLETSGSYSYVSKAECTFMFFIITAPEELVERGWQRGEETGRYRSPDDFLALAVDAYRGMQNKFFQRKDGEGPEFRYEFLNNNVPKGDDPTTVAYGTYDEMNILDVSSLMDVCRYQKIDISGSSADEIYPSSDEMLPENNLDFIAQCIEDIPNINFIDPETHRVYAQINAGVPVIIDADMFHEKNNNSDYKAVFDDSGFSRAVGYSLQSQSPDM
ncbi:MAG: hypothetical protein COB36_03675 [Alphaproteobacteria bacterium]|nr:MAG: hypothetical protein COB36_03675 [Alphaproteobacteria bacterium]